MRVHVLHDEHPTSHKAEANGIVDDQVSAAIERRFLLRLLV